MRKCIACGTPCEMDATYRALFRKRSYALCPWCEVRLFATNDGLYARLTAQPVERLFDFEPPVPPRTMEV